MNNPDTPSIFDGKALVAGAAALGVELSGHQVDQMIEFCSILEEVNRSLNLTRIPSEQYVPLHFLDSLSIAQAVAVAEFPALLDAGTGAGFPGLPLAIAFPELEVTLVDSTRKKLNFLDDACETLGVKNVRTVHSRMETLARDRTYRNACPLVTARALAPLEPLAELVLPLLVVGGTAVAFKGPQVEEEIKAAERIISELGCMIELVKPVTLPGSDATRSLIVIEKRAETPQRFPREKVR